MLKRLREKLKLKFDDGNLSTKMLHDVPILSALEEAELQAIIKAKENGIRQCEPKELIIRESEIGDCMYVVLEGSVEVLIRSSTGGRDLSIATLREGDFFGEQSLLDDNTDRRNASVQAITESTIFRIDKKYVLMAVAGLNEVTVFNAIAARPKEEKEVKKLITSMRLFKALEDVQIDMMDVWTEVIKLRPGELVLRESEKANCMYVVLEGTVEILAADEEGKFILLSERNRGSYFGELALLPGSHGKRTAYARSRDNVTLIKVQKSCFRLLLNRDTAMASAINKVADAQKRKRHKRKKS